ncbi:MAG: bifunctional diaminohydroxyphosphoribosylaminopyrimidine deaminase/5-amino-6-(5-phosphoribosylamino)uracil reductase RibD [bacterium]
MKKTDADWMRRARELAKRGLGWKQPNPCVGAVIIRNGQKLGEGYHKRAGGPHAEIEAIRNAETRGCSCKGATLYVTMEPCSTHGRTPPCAEEIIRRGFARVVVGATDPNPQHAGRAYPILKRAGIKVAKGVLEKECERLNVAFNHWIRTRRPWVIAKAAMTLDGFLKMPKKKRLTGTEARRDVHQLRAICGAILVGAETVRADNPRLTVRGVKHLRQPWRIVVTRTGNLPKQARLFMDRHKERTLVFQNKSWRGILRELGKRDVTRLLVEGGGKIFESLAQAKLINEVWIYYAPFLANPSCQKNLSLPNGYALQQMRLKNAELTIVGEDLKLRGFCASL